MFRIFVRNISVTASSMQSNSIKTPIPVFGIPGRYVTALYSAATQLKELDETEKTLKSLQKELGKPTIKDFMETSLISRAAKSKLLLEIGKEAGMPSCVSNFLSVVAENGRLKLLRRMINMFLTVMVAHKQETLCEVITATPLDEEDRKALMAALKKFVKEGKNIQLTERVDEAVVGGLVVGIDDKHVDLSVAKKISMYSDLIKIPA